MRKRRRYSNWGLRKTRKFEEKPQPTRQSHMVRFPYICSYVTPKIHTHILGNPFYFRVSFKYLNQICVVFKHDVSSSTSSSVQSLLITLSTSFLIVNRTLSLFLRYFPFDSRVNLK